MLNPKIRWPFVLAVVFAFAGGVLADQARPKLHAQTLKNLDTAMRGEAFANVKYRLFAKYARDSGHDDIAAAFSDAAETERFDHFSKEAALADIVGRDADNLKDAIKGESYEVDHMYKDFAEQARAAGDTQAADLFDEIRGDERQHRDTFKALLEKLESSHGQM